LVTLLLRLQPSTLQITMSKCPCRRRRRSAKPDPAVAFKSPVVSAFRRRRRVKSSFAFNLQPSKFTLPNGPSIFTIAQFRFQAPSSVRWWWWWWMALARLTM
jgi:hypothetical protein